MEKRINTELIIILIILSLSLLAAYIIEYGLGHAPCKLCIYQRVPYFLSIFLILNTLLTKKYIKMGSNRRQKYLKKEHIEKSNLIFENRYNMKEGLYLELMNTIKD